jgi:hypothetical protein
MAPTLLKYCVRCRKKRGKYAAGRFSPNYLTLVKDNGVELLAFGRSPYEVVVLLDSKPRHFVELVFATRRPYDGKRVQLCFGSVFLLLFLLVRLTSKLSLAAQAKLCRTLLALLGL